MQVHSLFLNAECYVQKYFCKQDAVIAVCLENQKLSLRVMALPNNAAWISPALMKAESNKCS